MENFLDMHVTIEGDKMSIGGTPHVIDYFSEEEEEGEEGGLRCNAIVHDDTDTYKRLDLIQDEKEGYRLRGIESCDHSAVRGIIRSGTRDRREGERERRDRREGERERRDPRDPCEPRERREGERERRDDQKVNPVHPVHPIMVHKPIPNPRPPVKAFTRTPRKHEPICMRPPCYICWCMIKGRV